MKRLISDGQLNPPWGLAKIYHMSSVGFSTSLVRFGPNVLLVGNFGDGKINAFNITGAIFLVHCRIAGESRSILTDFGR